mgnify:FL=1
MVVMGIDASTCSTGFSVFKDKDLIDYGVIKPDGRDWRERIVNQAPKLIEILTKYRPDKIYMEDVPLKAQNSKILVQLGAVQGFFYGLAASFNTPIMFLSPSEWLSPLGLFDGTREGTKRAEMKRKSVEKVNKMFGMNLAWKSAYSTKNEDDIADAVLIAYSQIKIKHVGRPNS